MQICATSDLHGNLSGLDFTDCDIVVVAGDLAPTTGFGYQDILRQIDFVETDMSRMFGEYPNTDFVVIPGNHDLFADPRTTDKYCPMFEFRKLHLPKNVHFIVNERKTVRGVKFFGLSWVPHINGRWAFEDGYGGEYVSDACSSIPDDTDVLITHSPPRFPTHDDIDVSLDYDEPDRQHFGSMAIYDAISCHPNLKYVFCGHIHSGDHTVFKVPHFSNGVQISETAVANVARMNEKYEPTYDPLRIFCDFEHK